MSAKPELVAIVAQRIDSGARFNTRQMAADLGVHRYDVLDAYKELAKRRGHDPLLERAERSLQRLREAGRPR